MQILIQGLKHLNRAVHEDTVAVELLPKEMWIAPSAVVLQDEGQVEEDGEDEQERLVRSNAVPIYCIASIMLGSRHNNKNLIWPN